MVRKKGNYLKCERNSGDLETGSSKVCWNLILGTLFLALFEFDRGTDFFLSFKSLHIDHES